MDRRPLKVRSAAWAQKLARILATVGLTPNLISIFSVGFALAAFVSAWLSPENKWYLILTAFFIQMRLICNLLDGMVAVEHNKSSPNGELFNDVPDRFADVFIIMGGAVAVRSISFPIDSMTIAWLASILAVITAYIRVLGKSLGTESYFSGPMAKQHRMFLMTLAMIAEFFLFSTDLHGKFLYGVLCLILVGSFYTTFRRLKLISDDLLAGAK